MTECIWSEFRQYMLPEEIKQTSALSQSQWFPTSFHISYPFIKQGLQIYPQCTQWSSFIENTKLKNSFEFRFRMIYSIKMYIGCNLWFRIFTPRKMKFTPRVNLPHVKNHWSKWLNCFEKICSKIKKWSNRNLSSSSVDHGFDKNAWWLFLNLKKKNIAKKT